MDIYKVYLPAYTVDFERRYGRFGLNNAESQPFRLFISGVQPEAGEAAAVVVGQVGSIHARLC
jgi:hypothetical protein